MKKIIFSTFILLSILAVSGCTKSSTQVKYEIVEIQDIVISQKGISTYDIDFKLSDEITDEKVYFTVNDSLKENDDEVSVVKSEGVYSFTVEATTADYFIYVVYGEKTVKHGVTMPSMAPTITTVVAAKTYISIEYGFNSSSSWSAFCDPTGKNVYRSSTTTFDENAEIVVKNENIVTEQSNDGNPTSEKPFYFIVLKSKNGNVTFISNALTVSENIVDTMSLQLTSKNDTPILEATVKFKSIITDNYKLKVVSGSEVYLTDGTLVGEEYIYNFDLSNLSRLGVWYDVVLINSVSGNEVSILDSNADMSTSVTTTDTKYTFKEWANLLKVNAEAFIEDDVVFTNITITTVDDKPTLTLVATSSQSFNVVITYDDEGTQTQATLNPKTNSNTYTFTYDLSKLGISGKWYDLKYRIDGVDKSIAADQSSFSDNVIVDGKKYEFKEWANELKVSFENYVEPAHTVTVTSITLTDEFGIPTLTLVATSTGDLTMEINSEIIQPTKEGNVYTFTYNLSSLTEAGKWYDINYVIEGISHTIDATIADFDNKITIDGKLYEFKEWSNQLKVQFTI